MKSVGFCLFGRFRCLIGFVPRNAHEVSTLTMLKKMDKRSRTVTGAFPVCGASACSAHLGFTLGVSPEMVLPLLAAKLSGAVLAAAIALKVTKVRSDDRTFSVLDTLQMEIGVIR